MKIYEVTRTDEIGGLGRKISKGAKAVSRAFMGQASKDAAYAADAGKEQTKEIANKIYTQWVSIASSKGIDLPNPKKDVIMDPKTRQPITDFSNMNFGNPKLSLANFKIEGKPYTYAKAVQQILNYKHSGGDFVKSVQGEVEWGGPKGRQALVNKLKKEWFDQEVFNREAKTQTLETGGGFYFSKLRRFLVDNGIREGTLDKICRGVYPDVPIPDDFEEDAYDNPRVLNNFLQKSFIKIAQKSTNFHGTYYGSQLSNDPVAQAKGTVDPNLIDGLKDLSSAQRQAIAQILASGLGLQLAKGSQSDATQKEFDM